MPNTLLIGAGKSGTTSLCDDLNLHPDVWIYPAKETHYFSYYFHKSFDYYESLFEPNGEKIVMEGSPSYTAGDRAPKAARRIYDALGANVKLIYMVSSPIRRIESSYVQSIANGFDQIPLVDAIAKWNLIDESLYNECYDAYAALFGEDAIHVIFLDDYIANKRKVMERLCDFLEISHNDEVSAVRVALNRRDEKVRDADWLKYLRNLPGVRWLRLKLSHSVKTKVKLLFLQKVFVDPQWTPDALKAAEARIRPDTTKFLIRHGKPADFWAFSKAV